MELSSERIIREAMERGEFSNLAGAGKPLDLDAYFAMPEDLRMGYAMLKSNDYVPDEVEKLREVGDLKEKIRICSDEAERAALERTLNEKNLALALSLESRKRRR